MKAAPQSRIIRFGPYEVDPESFQILKYGSRLKVQGQPFRILCILLDQPGELVTREQLRRALWPDDTFVDFEKSLNAGVARLRQALSDTADNPRFIETVPRQGYRFLYPVSYAFREAPQQATPPEVSPPLPPPQELDLTATTSGSPTPPNHQTPPQIPANRRYRLSAWLALSAALVLAATYPLWPRAHRPAGISEPLTVSRLTGTGDITITDISPDGKFVAIVRETAGHETLWLKQPEAQEDLQIVTFGEDQCDGVAFSADGAEIYFVRKPRHTPDGKLYRVPSLGGEPRLVLSGISGAPSISPDGRRVAFVRSTRAVFGLDTLVTASTAGGDERELIRYSAPGIRQNRVVWTSDGKRIVYTAMAKLTSIGADGSGARLVPDQKWSEVEDIAPSPYSGSEVLVTGFRLGSSAPLQIFRVSLDDDNTRQVTHDVTRYRRIRATADGQTLLVLEQERPRTIQLVTPSEVAGKPPVVRTLNADKQDLAGQWGLSWTPDGRILFCSLPYASERGELWIMDADGTNRRRVTQDPDFIYYADPTVAASGQFAIVTIWLPGDKANIWRLDMAGGGRKRLTQGFQDFPPALSPDGKWVVYKSVQGTRPVLMKVAANGGTPFQLTSDSCDQPAISRDGKRIACLTAAGNGRPPELAILPFGGGPPEKVFPLPSTAKPDVRLAWTLDDRAISFVNRVNGVSNIWNQPVAGGPPGGVTAFTAGDIFHFDWSPDNRLVLSLGEDTVDAMLIRGNR